MQHYHKRLVDRIVTSRIGLDRSLHSLVVCISTISMSKLLFCAKLTE